MKPSKVRSKFKGKIAKPVHQALPGYELTLTLDCGSQIWQDSLREKPVMIQPKYGKLCKAYGRKVDNGHQMLD